MAPLPTIPEAKPSVRPTSEQLERVAALRRFNWLYVYAPFTIVCLIVITLMGLMLWGVFSPDIRGTAEFLSALADIILILTLLPMMLFCAIGPALALVLFSQVNKRRRLSPELRRGKLQPLFWRIDRVLDAIYVRLRDRYLPMIARTVIKGHAVAAYVRSLLNYVQKMFGRS